MEKLINALPILGGSTGGMSVTLLTITWVGILDTILLAAIGAVIGAIVGFFVSMILKYLWKKYVTDKKK